MTAPPRSGWSGTDGGPGMPMSVGDGLTPAQETAARRVLARAAVRSGASAGELRQALDICGLLPHRDTPETETP